MVFDKAIETNGINRNGEVFCGGGILPRCYRGRKLLPRFVTARVTLRAIFFPAF